MAPQLARTDSVGMPGNEGTGRVLTVGAQRAPPVIRVAEGGPVNQLKGTRTMVRFPGLVDPSRNQSQ